jgi:APA family basic amino acid/polyamine antiporter
MADHPALVRRLGLGDATVLGLGSMLGAGVFAAFTPAAQAAGSGLLVGLVVAGLIALANATSSAQLAAVYPTSGGTYVYGRARLGPVWGFLAGWSFVIGKTASCAAMAITFAAYAAPAGWEKPVAILAVVALATVNLFGITRTALLTRVIVAIVLAVLALVVALGSTTGLPNLDLGPGLADDLVATGAYGVLQSAGLLFFAFAGYARIATLGDEVRDPARTIPRAIVLALSIVLMIYAVIAVVVLGVLGPDGVAAASAPLSAVVEESGFGGVAPVVRVGAAAASLGALLALIAGIGRTTLAMARERDLPRWLAAVHPRTRVPHRAEVVLALLVCAVIAVVDLRGAIGFSSFGVLLYYAIANASALTQPREQRLFPRWLAWLGVAGCVVLVITLPGPSIAIGVGILVVGLLIRALSQRASATNQSGDT